MRALLAEAPRGRAAARRRSRFAPLVLGVLAGCAELQTLENEVCGNGVIEQGEDCDFAEPGCRRPPAAGACRYECAHPSSGVKGPSCPEGFGCGVDNTCRRPAGSFSRTTERLAEAASALRVADFDGDGRDDVLTLGAPNDRGERAARVVFRDEGGFGVTTRVPNVFRSVAIGAFGDGPARGMAMVSNQGSLAGLNLLVGGPARGFASLVNPALGGANAALPASMRIIGVDALPRRAATGEGGATIEFNQGDEVVLLQPSVNGGGTSLFGLVSNQRDLPPNAPNPDALLVGLLTLGVNPAESEGGFAVGRFAAPGVGMPCEDIVWAPRELSEVYLLAPCRIEPPLPPSPSPSPPSPPVTLPPGVVTVWNEEGIAGRIEPRRVVLPEGARPAAGVERWVFVADVNDDGVSDLAVMTDRGVAFAFGKADGTPPEAALVAGPERVLLAFGDINHDRQPDWVFRDGIVLSELGLPAGVTRELAPAPWSEALVADFNGDGLLDVLAVGPASRSLDYYLSAESGFFNALNVPLEGVASRLAAGDFDGDSVVDVAFALGEESESDQRSVADAVFIAFGGKASSPGAPMRVGELRGVRQIAAGSYVFGGSGLDGADDLGLVGALDEGGGALVALLLGNAARQPLSPLLITGDSSLRPWAVAAGRFVGAEGGARLGLALLAGKLSEGERPYSFWLSSPSGGVTRFPPPEGDATVGAGTALPPEIGSAPPHGSPTNYAKGELPQMLVGDLNGDGLDEAAALVPQARGASLVIAQAAKGANGAAVLVADQLVEGLPRSILAGFADIDGNGAPDLVLLAPADESPNLTVYWNEGGGFDLGRSTRVEVPEGPALSWAAPSGPAGSRLFAINAAGVYAIDAGPGRAPRVEPLRELDGGEAIAAGDVTGDGVLDLVVGDGQSLRLVRGEPVLP